MKNLIPNFSESRLRQGSNLCGESRWWPNFSGKSG